MAINALKLLLYQLWHSAADFVADNINQKKSLKVEFGVPKGVNFAPYM